jgi:hypothetical protein
MGGYTRRGKEGDRRVARNEKDRRAWRGKEVDRREMGRMNVERKGGG